MKKLVSILLVSALLCCIIGCQSTPAAPAAPAADAPKTDAAPAAPQEPAAPAADAPKTTFPDGKTIKIICPYAAGGASDLLSRALGAKIGEILNCSVVVENQTGGAGAVGMNACLSGKPDGYTLVSTSGGACTLTPQHTDVGYTYEDFVSVCQVAAIPNVLYVDAKLGIKTFEEFITYCRANPGTTVGTSTYGLSQHMTMEGLAMTLNEPGLFNIVNFDGGSEVVAAVLGGQIAAGMNVQSEAAPHIQEGSFTGIATTNDPRTEALPDVPTFRELGYDVNDLVWYAMAAPAGTPAEVIEVLDNAFDQALKDPQIIEQMTKIGLPIAYLNHSDMDAQWQRDWVHNGEVIAALKAAG